MNDIPLRSPASRNSVLAAVCLATLTLPLSFSAGAVATPAIGLDLGGSPESLTRITNAFMLAFGSLLMAAGAPADRYGRRRIFLIGLGLFVGFSLALGLAPSIWLIDILRAGQGRAGQGMGAGAAAAFAGGMEALAQEFDGHARTRAFGLLGTTFGVGLASGPLLTGALIEMVGWRPIFLVVRLFGLLALILGPPRMRETKDPDAGNFGRAGALSFTLTLTLFTVAMIELPSLGTLRATALAAGFVLSLATFILTEMRGEGGAADARSLRSDARRADRRDDAGTACLAGHPFRHWSSHRRRRARLACHCQGEDGAMIVLPMLVIGVGAGLPWGLMDGLSVSVAPVERAGLATVIFSTVRVAGEGVALAIVSAALADLVSTSLGQLVPLTPSVLQEAGQRLAVGDLAGAAAVSANQQAGLLREAYQTAFSTLCWWLAALTGFCAVAIFVLLPGRVVADVGEVEQQASEQR